MKVVNAINFVTRTISELVENRKNYHSGFTDEINSTAFTSNRNISALKISNNGVKLDVPKDLTSQITVLVDKQVLLFSNI